LFPTHGTTVVYIDAVGVPFVGEAAGAAVVGVLVGVLTLEYGLGVG